MGIFVLTDIRYIYYVTSCSYRLLIQCYIFTVYALRVTEIQVGWIPQVKAYIIYLVISTK